MVGWHVPFAALVLLWSHPVISHLGDLHLGHHVRSLKTGNNQRGFVSKLIDLNPRQAFRSSQTVPRPSKRRLRCRLILHYGSQIIPKLYSFKRSHHFHNIRSFDHLINFYVANPEIKNGAPGEATKSREIFRVMEDEC